MDVMILMLLGVFVGYRWFPERWGKVNANIQVVCIALLIFSMGVKLGSRENFLSELTQLGWKSLLFALTSILFSVLFVYFFSEKWIKKAKKNTEDQEKQTGSSEEEVW